MRGGARVGGGQWGCAPRRVSRSIPRTTRSWATFRGDKQRLGPRLGPRLRPAFVLQGRTTWASAVPCVRSHPRSFFPFLLASAPCEALRGGGFVLAFSRKSWGRDDGVLTSLSAGTGGAPSRPLQWGILLRLLRAWGWPLGRFELHCYGSLGAGQGTPSQALSLPSWLQTHPNPLQALSSSSQLQEPPPPINITSGLHPAAGVSCRSPALGSP